MSLTLGMTGMDSATETALKAAVDEANAKFGQPWQLLPEAQADHVVVDMDSMYGPMSWLRLHAAGKRVIGLSSAARTQTDFHLSRPFDTNSVAALLEQAAAAGDPAPVGSTVADDTQAHVPPVETADAHMQNVTPATPPEDADETTDTSAALPAAADAEPVATSANDPVVADTTGVETAEAEPPQPPPPVERRLADWLVADTLRGRVRYQPVDGPALLIDADRRQYHGPTTLKPLAGFFGDVLESDAFNSIDDDTWAADSAALGPAQPLSRLQWYGGLLAGKGELLPGYDPDGRYVLGKWPLTEREFPRHFRLATTMMKGPATLDAIASASGVPRVEVIDFINANLTSGYAEFVPESPPEPLAPPKPTGLFGRLRGK